MAERHRFDVLDDHRAALSALGTSARYCLALGHVPEAAQDALALAADWADVRLAAALVEQSEILERHQQEAQT